MKKTTAGYLTSISISVCASLALSHLSRRHVRCLFVDQRIAGADPQDPSGGSWSCSRQHDDHGVRPVIGRMAYVWGYPMVNAHNRRAAFAEAPAPGLLGGVVPVAPVGYNRC